MGMPYPAEEWTADRVRDLPDDGRRYELVDGALLVTPAPGARHQIAVRELVRRIDPWLLASGAGELLWSPADIAFADGELLQPDLFVYRTAGGGVIREWRDIESLILVVEVISPSTARHDRGIKRRRYQRARVPEYWIVDPDARLVERWRPYDARPEILETTAEWRPVEGIEPLVMDLVAVFDAIGGP